MNCARFTMNVPGPIIVIDDDADDQHIFNELLTDIGVASEIRMFDNCPKVLEYLRTTREKPFIILCDINIPIMNGLEFRKIVNEDDHLRQKSIPFVFMSTTANINQVIEAYRLTVQGFFVKQSTMKEMDTTLRSILEYWKSCVHPNSFRT